MNKIQWAGLIGATLVIISALVLIAFNQPSEVERMQERVKLAQICTDGGGVYTNNAWAGYFCEFDD